MGLPSNLPNIRHSTQSKVQLSDSSPATTEKDMIKWTFALCDTNGEVLLHLVRFQNPESSEIAVVVLILSLTQAAPNPHVLDIWVCGLQRAIDHLRSR